MLTVKLPKIIDPESMKPGLNYAESIISLRHFDRLCNIAENHDTDIKVSLSWGIDSSGQSLVQGKISAVFALQCQRCLATFDKPIEREFSLTLKYKRSQVRQQQVDEFCRLDEDKLFLEAGETIIVLDLIEDEMMLSLPMHIKHDVIDDCDPNMLYRAIEYKPDSETVKESPFKVLQNLKTLE